MGDGVKTGQRSTAGVVFDDGTHVVLKESTTVRFLETKPGSAERGLKVVSGEVRVEVQEAQLLLRTEVGLARLEAGSIVRIGRGKQGLRFFVKVGKARLESRSGHKENLSAGQGVEVTVDLAVIERFGDKSADKPPAATSLSKEAEAAAALEKEPIIAVVSGPGTRVQSAGQKTWTALPAGETPLSPGSKLRLGKGGNATVRRGAQSAQLEGPGDYLVEGTPDRFVTLLSGITILTAEGMDVGLEVVDGSVVAQGSRGRSVAEVSLQAKKLVGVTARHGTVVVSIGGKQETLRPGESVTITPGGDQKLYGRGIGFADVTLAAGGSLAVHDPDPPTAVGFTFAKDCPERGIVELLGRGGVAASAAGQGAANLRVSAGRHPYRVRCLGEKGPDPAIAARGTVTVLRDAGTAPLAAGAPSTSVDTDGRSYTVLYQNRLPRVTVRWPHPPQASSYVLVHQGPGGTRSMPTSGPIHALRSGAVVEGRHVLTFQAGDKQSRPTTVTVKFDPAAPKASINSPDNAGFAPNSTIEVSGMALPGWRVFAGATELALDAQHRFSGSATAGNRVLLIRFQHPARGGELYLRRAAGVPR
jgi:hypothetical protein